MLCLCSSGYTNTPIPKTPELVLGFWVLGMIYPETIGFLTKNGSYGVLGIGDDIPQNYQISNLWLFSMCLF